MKNQRGFQCICDGISTSFSCYTPVKLTWQWKMDPLKMYFLLKMVIFYCYVSLPEVISKAGVVVSVQPDMFK